MPKFGFTQEESEILEWLKNDGDKVEKGDPIAVVSTDKISMEVESPESGILDGIRYKVGDIVPEPRSLHTCCSRVKSCPKVI
jgi:pyruvate dehydrogenase E2 component (dihydrolipoamide acetyltransferase)